MGTRTWFKVFAKQWLEGSFMTVKMDIKGAWISLLAVHSMTESDQNGILTATPGIGYTDSQLAKMMHLSYRKWVRYKAHFVKHDMIGILPNNVIKINNWSKYQSEYRRQKSYRPKLQPEVTRGSYNTGLQPIDRDKERDKDFIKTPTPKYSPKHGTPVPSEPVYFCKICSDKNNIPINHKYSEIKWGTCGLEPF